MIRVPNPATFAGRIPLNAKDALLTAYEGRDGWQVQPCLADIVRPFGLVDTRTPHLSVFGIQVRRKLLERRSAA